MSPQQAAARAWRVLGAAAVLAQASLLGCAGDERVSCAPGGLGAAGPADASVEAGGAGPADASVGGGGQAGLPPCVGAERWQELAPPPAVPTSLFLPPLWTGTELIAWTPPEQEGKRAALIYSPRENSWRSTETLELAQPSPFLLSAWAGERAVLWNCEGREGGMYDLVSDTWTAISTAGAPQLDCKIVPAVSMGSRMLVWGGQGGDADDYGAVFDVPSNSWLPMSQQGAPDAYDPVSDTWTPTSNEGAPAPKSNYPPPLWTGDRVLVIGGIALGVPIEPSGLYDPESDSWTPVDVKTAPQDFVVTATAWVGCQAILVGLVFKDPKEPEPAAWAYEPPPAE
ncbi:MAG: hypothetical protein HY744_00705 [Deltaproteobacteria bacterium]|nr:hypothetical protein [Deltaproteobacteria bacterium]